jgi:general secretion pathway protein G
LDALGARRRWAADQHIESRTMVSEFNAFRRKPLPRRARRTGFSLVELLVGLVILGLIAGLVVPRLLGDGLGEREHAAQAQIKAFASALDLFRLDTGRYPTTSEGLDALVRRPGPVDGWAGPYLKNGILPQDPWGQAYTYSAPGKVGPYAITAPSSAGLGHAAIGVD